MMLAKNKQLSKCRQCNKVFDDLDKYIKHAQETKHIGVMLIDIIV
jgi:uncharacterized C2H2 Zn-finger protein